MEALSNILRFLYSTFLLRDIFGKAVPGAIVLFCVVGAVLAPPGESTAIRINHVIGEVARLPIAIQFFLIGLCWILGFVVQQVGIRIKLPNLLLKWLAAANMIFGKRPSSPPLKNQLLLTEPCGPQRVHIEKVLKASLLPDPIQALVERHVTIKEATGNLAMALVVGPVLYWLLEHVTAETWFLPPWWEIVGVGLAWLVVVAALIDRHRHQTIVLEELRSQVSEDWNGLVDRYRVLLESSTHALKGGDGASQQAHEPDDPTCHGPCLRTVRARSVRRLCTTLCALRHSEVDLAISLSVTYTWKYV